MRMQRPLSASLRPGTCRILRSPSRDSFTTDLSLLTVSSISGVIDLIHTEDRNKIRINKISRETSPIPGALDLQRKSEMMWIDECNDLIKNCGKLSTLGIQKSFSTNDITELSAKKPIETNSTRNGYGHSTALRHAVSELALNSIQRCGYFLDGSALSRSCSTWVQVAELASQLPSPHGHCTSLTITSSQQQLNATSLIGGSSQPFTATDLIKSVNKKVRETYIRSRLLTTNRAIERLSQSEFNLDQLASVATTSIPISESAIAPGPTELIVPSIFNTNKDTNTDSISSNVEISATQSEEATAKPTESNIDVTTTAVEASTSPKMFSTSQKFTRNLTIQDIEKQRGRPLSKYDRNMMIFNWLHSLDETSTVEDT